VVPNLSYPAFSASSYDTNVPTFSSPWIRSLYERKRALEPKLAKKHPLCQSKTEANQAKRLANPGDGRIIMKTAKNSSLTPWTLNQMGNPG
jgi:hypothetical protein